MTSLLGLGAGLGAGLWALAVWAWPPRLDLPTLLRRLDPAPPPPAAPEVAPGWPLRMARPLTRVLAAGGLPRPGLAADLAVLQRPAAVHLAYQATATLAGAAAPALAVAVLTGLGAKIGWLPPAWATLLGAAAGLAIPDRMARASAARRRRELRHALSAYLDLLVVSLAGGAGIDGAMTNAASVGRGWAFDQLRHALATARLTNTTSWTALARLGDELAIPELTELATAASLAGNEGAKVRGSLTASAATWRVHQLTDAETEANAATERMSLPVVLLFAGFLLFIGYPAVAAVLGGL